MTKKILFSSITIIAILLFFEAMLRLSGVYKTFSERTTGKFASYYDQQNPGWYQTWKPNQQVVYDNPEFKCSFPANSLGLREKEIPLARKDSTQRLFVIGDSFVEGDGVDYPNSMPRFLEKRIDSSGMKFEVFNTGVCGSDPFFEYTLLRDKLIRYQPTHVILCINNSDIGDYIYRGGMERFQADGTTKTRRSPWWKPIYVHSHLFRFFATILGYDETFLSPKEEQKQIKVAVDKIYECLDDFKLLCEKNHIKYIVVIHPFPDSYKAADVYDHRIRCRCATTNPINMIDLYYDFDKHLNQYNYLQYGYKIDKHFNAKGYQLFAELLFNKINECDSTFWE